MHIHSKLKMALRASIAGLALAVSPIAAAAQDNPFAPGWILDTDISALRFQSVKNATKVESSSFSTYKGSIDDAGVATIKVKLDSVDTKVDLRNVRMRFLMFETFKFPEAVIKMDIDPASLADLQEVRRKVMVMPYTISLHGVTSAREAEIAVTLLDDNKVSVTSATPISIPVADFELQAGLQKLEEAAKVVIVPSATVSFDFTFDRAESPESFKLASGAIEDGLALASTAIEEDGDFSTEACKGRFEIMSRTDSIFFGSGSAQLDDRSAPLLDSITDIISRCNNLVVQVIGHTDSDGSEQVNQILSEARASSVKAYFETAGVEQNRLIAVGNGEASPAFPNDTPENKSRNRRIEFVALSR